jgi:LCP family protein required for cell wall assembly
MKTKKPRRTWPQRLTLGLVVLVALTCFATAAGLATGQWVLSQRNLITLDAPTSARSGAESNSPSVILPGATTIVPTEEPEPESGAELAPGVTTTTIALTEPAAANFLIVGVDNNACVDETGLNDDDDGRVGERSDTIMIWRANPEVDQLAVLSLPRDLYVDVAGGRRARINSAFRRDDPTKLIDTIFLNFGIPIDHYVQVDFCAFERLVDAVGGVEVPFAFPARDERSGLLIPEAGCVRLDGDDALAYVRSRHYQYEDPEGSGDWYTDGTSDFGRIARQQDFLRRVIATVVNDGLYSPSVATALITTNREYLVTDTGLTVRRMLEFATTLRRLDPTEITTYRVESTTETTDSGELVERPRTGGSNMQAILAVFRGEATLASAPDQEFEPSVAISPSGDPDGQNEAAATLPEVEADENIIGIAPDRDVRCG